MSDSGFSKAELDAIKERAAELRAQKGGNKKAKNLEALMAAIAQLPAAEKVIATALHQCVTSIAPELEARLWYGMPAYAKDGQIVVFLQLASKFDTRYSTLGFEHAATLDDGDLWPTHFAIPAMSPAVEQAMTDLVTKATRQG